MTWEVTLTHNYTAKNGKMQAHGRKEGRRKMSQVEVIFLRWPNF